MKRQIKFRGKRLDNGERIFGDLIENQGRYFIYHATSETTLEDNDDNKITVIAVEIAPETVGQFTGLCDKNDKEIYEGDIVHYQDSMGYSFVSPIEFREGKFCMKTKYSNCITFSNKGRYNDGKCSFEYNIEHEVLGNIHDNPDLLNGK